MSRIGLLVVAVAALTGFLLASRGLAFHWNPDDSFVVGSVDGTSPWSNGRFDAWSFVKAGDRDRLVFEGALPWWTAKNFKYELWRPVSSAILYATHAAFGWDRWWYQLVSALSYVAFILVVGAVYFATLPRATAMVSVAIFAVASSHMDVLYWLAAMHYLVAGALAALSLFLWVRYREAGGAWHLVASCASLLAGFLASEAAFAGAGFLVAYELCRGGRSLRRNLAGAAGPILLCAAYVIVYKLAGKGIAGEGSHVDPFEHPWLFARAVVRNSAFYIVQLFAAGKDWRLVCLGIVGLVLGRLVWRGERADRERIGLYGLGLLLSLVPLGANEYSLRSLVLPSIGACALLGLFVVACTDVVRKAGRRAPRALAAAALGIVMTQQGVAHARSAAAIYRARSDWSRPNQFLLSSSARFARKSVFVVGGGEFLYAQLGGDYIRRLTGNAPQHWYALSSGDGQHEIRRVDEDTIELTLPNRGYFFRSERDSLHEGAVFATEAYTVTVLAVAGAHARRVRVDFSHPIDPREDIFITLVGTEDAPEGRVLSLPAIGDSAAVLR
jgi:hypothetical protein